MNNEKATLEPAAEESAPMVSFSNKQWDKLPGNTTIEKLATLTNTLPENWKMGVSKDDVLCRLQMIAPKTVSPERMAKDMNAEFRTVERHLAELVGEGLASFDSRHRFFALDCE